jgi:hypothetical protein
MIKETLLFLGLIVIWVSLAVMAVSYDKPNHNYGENNCINLDAIELQSYRIDDQMEAINPNWKTKH